MKKFILIISSIIFINCSSVKNSEPEFICELSDVFAWVDLMPGGEPGFHLTGRLDIYSADNDAVPQLSEIEIKLYQDEKNIYSFFPKLEYSLKQKDGINAHLFTFYPEKRLSVKKINVEKHISMKCIFKIHENSHNLFRDSIQINKVY